MQTRIHFHHQFLGLPPLQVMRAAQVLGLAPTFEDQDYCLLPGRLYIKVTEGRVTEAYEVRESLN